MDREGVSGFDSLKMRAVVQRVSRAAVRVDGEVVGEIGQGLLILLGVTREDTEEDRDWLAGRLVKLRIFDDEEGRMNRSLLEIGGEVLVVSQFTLFGTMKKGSRPSYNRAAGPDLAVPLYEGFAHEMERLTGKQVATGKFGADMKVELLNDGPVTIIIDSKERDF